MFDYFRNRSSNVHHVCCEDSPTESHYNLFVFSPMSLLFIQGHNYVLLGSMSDSLSYGIQTWHTGRIMHGIDTHAHFGDLDARSQWVGKGKQTKTKQAKSIHVATTLGRPNCLRDLAFENVYMAWPFCLYLSSASCNMTMIAMIAITVLHSLIHDCAMCDVTITALTVRCVT